MMHTINATTRDALRQRWEQLQIARAEADEINAGLQRDIMHALRDAGASISNDRICLDCGSVLHKRVADCPTCAAPPEVQP